MAIRGSGGLVAGGGFLDGQSQCGCLGLINDRREVCLIDIARLNLVICVGTSNRLINRCGETTQKSSDCKEKIRRDHDV